MDNNNSVQTRLLLPGNMIYLPLALSFITQSAEVYPFTQQEISRIRLASEEAISNIMTHALSNNVHEQFTITCQNNHSQFEITIHEKGKPFDPSRVPAFDPEKLRNNGDTNGLGLFLMKKVMDEIVFRNLGRDGKETVLVKYLEKDRIDRLTPIKKPEYIPSTPTGTHYQIRDFIKTDTIGISECAFTAYGYSYESYIYYPNKIKRMNEQKQMISYVAKTDLHGIAGHIAFKFDNNQNCAELGVAFVKPEFRGKHIFNALTDYALVQAKKLPGLKCIFSRAVTAHPFSQKMALKRQFIPTGIQLALFPLDVDFKSISNKGTQKGSSLSMSLNTGMADTSQTIYIPEQHTDMVHQIFDQLYFDIKTGTPAQPVNNQPPGAILTSSIMDVFNTGDIYCHLYSSSAITEIRQTLRNFCIEQVAAIYLYLDMTEPAMPHIAEQCEQMGFIFSGVQPFGINGHHALVLQYLNNIRIDFNLIKVADPFSESIKSYIENIYNNTIINGEK